MRELLTFKPLYQERVWGGRMLAKAFARALPSGERPVGESWEIVDRPEAQSVVARGEFAGETLRSIITRHAGEIMGPGWPAQRPFPILVKWLDCRERLSLQVHPPASLAASLRGEPKTENWFIAAAEPGAALMVGLKRGVTRTQFEQAMADQTLEGCVHRFAVGAGDSILVRSGTVHAIDAGNLILEIQQNSDTTYRVYDWGRTGLDGRPRQLHVRESLASIDWNESEPAPVRSDSSAAVIADCPEFRIRRMPLVPGQSLDFKAREQPRLLHVVTGRLVADGGAVLAKGENVLLPYAGAFKFNSPDGASVLVTENFNH